MPAIIIDDNHARLCGQVASRAAFEKMGQASLHALEGALTALDQLGGPMEDMSLASLWGSVHGALLEARLRSARLQAGLVLEHLGHAAVAATKAESAGSSSAYSSATFQAAAAEYGAAARPPPARAGEPIAHEERARAGRRRDRPRCSAAHGAAPLLGQRRPLMHR